MEIELLKNLEIESLKFTEEFLIIKTKDGKELKYEAYGDCCSSSYIESLDNIEAMQNTLLISVEVAEGDIHEFRQDDVHKWTFYKFKTTKGMCTLSFRNESNGYYNGELIFVKNNETRGTYE